MKRCFSLVSLLLLLVLLPPKALAWGSEGHRLICDITWRNLDKPTKAWVLAAVHKKRFKTFASACNWADWIKRDKQYDEWKPRHYVNQAVNARVAVLTPSCDKSNCVISVIDTLRQSLARSHAGRPMSKTEAEEILFLAHFVGDIHQPLHVSFAHDRGGNHRKITFFGKGKVSLHRVWDQLLLTHGNNDRWFIRGKKLADDISTGQRQQWQASLAPLDWATESLHLTQDIYAHTENEIGDAYYQRYNPIVIIQIQRAGVRLAALLNHLNNQRQ